MLIKETKDLRISNTLKVLSVLRAKEQATRTELALWTKLNKATITNITKTLLEFSIIEEGISLESSGGRRPTVLSICHDLGYCIAVDLQIDTVDFLVISLSDKILYEITIPMVAEDSGVMIQNIVTTIYSILSKTPDTTLGLCGIAISVDGVVDLNGNISFIPQLKWHNIELKNILEKEFQVYTLIDNTGNFRVMREAKLYPNYKDIVSVHIGSSISCGILTNGKLVKGFLGYANTIGHQIINFHEESQCSCGRRGCWEQYSSTSSILKYFNNKTGKNISSLNDFIYLVKLKDSSALAVLDEFVSYLTIGLENIVFIFNCECIILSGEIFDHMPYLVDELNKKMIMPITHYQNILISKLAKQAPIVGAASICIDNFFLDYVSNIKDKEVH